MIFNNIKSDDQKSNNQIAPSESLKITNTIQYYILCHELQIILLLQTKPNTFLLMIGKREMLPRIEEKRLKTQQKGDSRLPSHPKLRRFTYGFNNSLSQNQHIKSWHHKDEELRKMRLILQQNQKNKIENDLPNISQSKQSSSLQKNTIISRGQEASINQRTSTDTQSFTIHKSKVVTSVAALDEVQIFFNLQIKNGHLTKEKIKNFNVILEEHNIFFKKIGPVISETFLKIGVVNTYFASQYVYKESFPIKGIGIILWGSVYLKFKKAKVRFNCTAGNTIGEQILFEKIDYDSKRYSSVQNGRLCTNQRCRAVEDSGILFINQKEYHFMFENMIKWGFKDQMQRCHNILHRNYFKKREFRGLMN